MFEILLHPIVIRFNCRYYRHRKPSFLFYFLLYTLNDYEYQNYEYK